MTDLSKGIIEIEGIEINSDTTSTDIKTYLSNVYANCATSKDGTVEIFRFENITLSNECFKIKITFIREKMSHITLFSHIGENLSYEERFKANCDWLKSVLGEPDEIHNDGNSYYRNDKHIYSFIQRDLSRNPAETFIVCKYNR